MRDEVVLQGVATAVPLADDAEDAIRAGEVDGHEEELVRVGVVEVLCRRRRASGDPELYVVARPPPALRGGGLNVVVEHLDADIQALVAPAEIDVGRWDGGSFQPDGLCMLDLAKPASGRPVAQL